MYAFVGVLGLVLLQSQWLNITSDNRSSSWDNLADSTLQKAKLADLHFCISEPGIMLPELAQVIKNSEADSILRTIDI